MKKIILLLVLMFPFYVEATEAVIDVSELSITEIQEYVDKGYLTYEQLANIYLERINTYNEQYNAVISINEDIIEQARQLDIEYKETGRRSLVHGIPIMVKDNIDVVGMPTTNGAEGLLDSYPYNDADVIKKLRDAGALFIGKTNMDEFAFSAWDSHSSFGYVYNAYNTDYSSYGSSGGSAVVIAADLAVAALGTDTGLSIRIPAAANNIVGLRPSSSIIDESGVIKFDAIRDTVGPMTKYVSDNAIILEIIDNTDTVYNTYSNDLTGVTIGVFSNLLNNSTFYIREMMQEQINNLEQLGATIKYINTFYAEYKFDATTMCYDFNQYIKGTSSEIKSLDDLIKNGGYTQYIGGYNGYYCNNDYRQTSEYQSYLDYQTRTKTSVNSQFINAGVDAVIYPTIQNKLIKISEIDVVKPITYGSNLAPVPGFPSMNIPIGFNDGLPYGMEILALEYNENTIYDIGYNLEKMNNFYEVSSIAPTLYEPVKELEELLLIYELDLPDDYNAVKEKTRLFIENYSNEQDKVSQISNLITEYLNVEIKVEVEPVKYNFTYNIYIISGLLVIGLIVGVITPIYTIKKNIIKNK